MSADPLEAIKVTFFQECDELLGELETGLLAMEAGEGDDETVNAVFRAVHSVKGGAGAFGLEALVRFAHVFETAMDEMRTGRLAPEGPVIKVLLRAADILTDLVNAAKTDSAVDEARSAGVAAELKEICNPGSSESGEGEAEESDGYAELGFKPVRMDVDMPDAAPVADHKGPSAWSIQFRPRPELYAKANDCLTLLRELARLGDCQLELDRSTLPALEDMDPEGSYLAWTISLTTEHLEAEIRDVFEFVDGDCDLVIERMSGPEPDDSAEAALPVEPVEQAAPEPALDVEALIAAASAPREEPAPSQTAEGPAPAGGVPAAAAAPAAAATIRVDLDRVDRLIDLVGELVINQAMLNQRMSEAELARTSAVAVALEELEQLTREIQDSVMAIRAQPVKSVFQRLPRLVREVAAMTGKQARLVTEGENTEVDKTVIERLSDPLTHMIRNAIDHGLESPEERVAAGKPAEGTVRLSAEHRSGRVLIEVGDDGKGINRARVREIAANKGLIDPAVALTDDEVDNLIFLPGFSTAAVVSDVSGRGVGMDVVKRSIQALGGRISIVSRPGEGSTFTLSLPLTLAVLDGMVVAAEEHTLVAPLTIIVETLQPKRENVRALGPQGTVLMVRGAHVPLIDVGVALGYRTEPLDPCEGVALLVAAAGGGRAALLVDAIQGQRQVVIKSLEANYQQVDGVAAATILG
ncbi:MAG: chemotaxis protein CheA, partial [Phenylobacterium sp.]